MFKYSLKDLEVIRTVGATGSITEAARQLHVSQPAISHRLSALQDRIGTPLFLRIGGRMQPTPVGDQLVRAAESVQRVMAQTDEDISELLGERQRHFRFTTQCHTSVRWMSFLIRDMVTGRPDLTIDFVPEAVTDPCGAVQRGEVDVALVYQPDERSTGREETAFADEMFAVMSSDHPLAGRKYLNPTNFEGETLILYSGPRFALIDHVLSPAGVAPGRVRQVRLTEAMVELARAGQGIAVMAGWAINDLASRRDLAAVRIGRRGYRRTWRALINRACPDELADAFLANVRRIAEQLDNPNWRQSLEGS